LSDDYPVLIAPGQPELRTNVSLQEIIRYSPQKADVLNMETNRFETVDLKVLFTESGNEYPNIERVVSVFEHGDLRRPMGLNTDYSEQDLIVTFDGLINNTKFTSLVKRILKELQSALATPVDIEFASNGTRLYLLQCRPQSYSKYDTPTAIPVDIPKKDILFSANRYVSNGLVPEISHIVYVDPESYNELNDIKKLKNIGKAIGRLNEVLPKQKFILMGPGRWGSRGDIKLGVSVTYSDINNTAALIEIARKKGNYVPDLSFGTHFFQDLVEASIRYLPLYPDNNDVHFDEEFLLKSENIFAKLVPDLASLEKTIHVIKVPDVIPGKILRILMNAELEKAVAIFSAPGDVVSTHSNSPYPKDYHENEHAIWRQKIVSEIASQLEAKRFGIKELFLAGSSQNQTASAASDIDLIVYFSGTDEQKNNLDNWFEGWSLCLDEINYQRTGFKAGGLLHIKYIDTPPDNSTGLLTKLILKNTDSH